MEHILLAVMSRCAQANSLGSAFLVGSFTNQESNKGAQFLPGAVYGFCARLSEHERTSVFQEAQDKGTSALATIDLWSPISENIYPLYWGKDKMLGSRIYGHLQNHKQTGIVRFCRYAALRNKSIGCAVLPVSDYDQLERALHQAHPHLLKTSNNHEL